MMRWCASTLERAGPTLQQSKKGLVGDSVKVRGTDDASSAITWIQPIKAPLSALHGGNSVEAHNCANEGHGFAKHEYRIDAIRRTLAWLGK